jgi:hypothetical protein
MGGIARENGMKALENWRHHRSRAHASIFASNIEHVKGDSVD